MPWPRILPCVLLVAENAREGLGLNDSGRHASFWVGSLAMPRMAGREASCSPCKVRDSESRPMTSHPRVLPVWGPATCLGRKGCYVLSYTRLYTTLIYTADGDLPVDILFQLSRRASALGSWAQRASLPAATATCVLDHGRIGGLQKSGVFLLSVLLPTIRSLGLEPGGSAVRELF